MSFLKDQCWKDSLKNSIRTPAALLSYLELDSSLTHISTKAQSVMPIMIPITLAARIKKGDINDPILLQILPSVREEKFTDISFVLSDNYLYRSTTTILADYRPLNFALVSPFFQ